MKTGDKAFVRIGGVVYVGTVKRAFTSPFGVPSVWIEWPKDNPSPSRNIFYERDLMSPTDERQDQRKWAAFGKCGSRGLMGPCTISGNSLPSKMLSIGSMLILG